MTMAPKPPTEENEKRQATTPKKRPINRNASIEKIIKFNAYICSQNFFILPSILAWLKTSQNTLQSYSEKCTQIVKLLTNELIRIVLEIYANPSKSLSFATYDLLSEEAKKILLQISTYFSLFLISLQLTTCLVFLALNSLPGGLIFMLAALSHICYLNYLCLRLVIFKQRQKDEQEKDFENEATTKYIKPKDILGKRTISSLNLF